MLGVAFPFIIGTVILIIIYTILTYLEIAQIGSG